MSDHTAFASFQDQFAALRREFEQQLEQDLLDIEATWRDVLADDTNHAAAVRLHQQVHKLTGTSATFGFVTLSGISRALERFLRASIEDVTGFDADQRMRIETDIESLKLAACLGEPVTSDNTEAFPPPVNSSVQQEVDRNRTIFLIEDDTMLIRELSLQISYFGYSVQAFSQLFDLQTAVQQVCPAAVIMDIIFPEGDLAGADAIRSLRNEMHADLPVIFISSRSDFIARLHAVQAGGSAYFTKPIDISGLIDKLDTLTAHKIPEPYRILIVEDDSSLAMYYDLILRHAGMLTTIVTNPMQVMEPLSDFRPDLILMDVYMPVCNGLDLAAVIRQEETYVSIPIVFLSSETDTDKQLAAMSLGGDDFLTKPIQPDHLVSSVLARAQRSRILRSFMVRDSLTGLYNHTRIKELLNIEITRALRQRTPLTFAMIDIDHFKSVNDTYGHSVGDRVLKSLVHMLQQRLRKTDIIGRYGGEEFAIVLTNIDTAKAYIILDELREQFARLRQHYGKDTFSVTFSCGLASLADYRDAIAISDAADKALYEAKRSGRNRVVVATEYTM